MEFWMLYYLNLFNITHTNHQLEQNAVSLCEFINYFATGV